MTATARMCVHCSGLGCVARQGAPCARIAVHMSVCAGVDGNTTTILAAIDDVIHDEVDVLSLFIGVTDNSSFGALHAVQKGITVVYAGGCD